MRILTSEHQPSLGAPKVGGRLTSAYELVDEEMDFVQLAGSQLLHAYDLQAALHVCVEKLSADACEADQARLFTKREFAASFDSPHIVSERAYFEADAAIVWNGVPLRFKPDLCRPDLAAKILKGALHGLHEIHSSGKLHGNISAACLFVGTNQEIQIGNSPGLEPSDPGLLAPADGLYAPENVDPDLGDIAESSDLFCLGMAILEILYPKKVHQIYRGDQKCWASSRESAAHLTKKLPPELREFFEQLVAKEPDLRFGTSSEAIDALEQATASSSEMDHSGKSGAQIRIHSSPLSGSLTGKSRSNLLDNLADKEWLKKQIEKPAFLRACIGIMTLVAASGLWMVPSAYQPHSSVELAVEFRTPIPQPGLSPQIHVDTLTAPFAPPWSSQEFKLMLEDNATYNIWLTAPGFAESAHRKIQIKNGSISELHHGEGEKEVGSLVFEMTPTEYAVKVKVKGNTDGQKPKIEVSKLQHSLQNGRDEHSNGKVREVVETVQNQELELKLPAGRYLVEASLDGHTAAAGNLIVRADRQETQELELTLTPMREIEAIYMSANRADGDTSVPIVFVNGQRVSAERDDEANLTRYSARVEAHKTVKLRALMNGYEPFEKSLEASANAGDSIVITMNEKEREVKTLKLIIRTQDIESAPDNLLIGGQQIDGITTDDYVEYTASNISVDQPISILGNSRGFNPIEHTIEPSEVDGRSVFHYLLPRLQRLPESERTGKRFRVSTIHRTGERGLIHGLQMLVDGKPVLGEQDRPSPPFDIYLETGFHDITFLNENQEVVYSRPAVRFSEHLSTLEFLIQL